MATFLEVVNSVLRRLSEPTVSTVVGQDYASLIGEFVNDVKREIEDSYSWTVLRHTENVSTVSGTDTIVIPNSSERTKVLRIFNTDQYLELHEVTSQYMDERNAFPNPGNGLPSYYKIDGFESNGNIRLRLYLTPAATYNIRIHCVTPQPDFTLDTDITTGENVSVKIDSNVLTLGTVAKAIEERGEDGGQAFVSADARYRNALGRAILTDLNFNKEDSIWVVD